MTIWIVHLLRILVLDMLATDGIGEYVHLASGSSCIRCTLLTLHDHITYIFVERVPLLCCMCTIPTHCVHATITMMYNNCCLGIILWSPHDVHCNYTTAIIYVFFDCGHSPEQTILSCLVMWFDTFCIQTILDGTRP